MKAKLYIKPEIDIEYVDLETYLVGTHSFDHGEANQFSFFEDEKKGGTSDSFFDD